MVVANYVANPKKTHWMKHLPILFTVILHLLLLSSCSAFKTRETPAPVDEDSVTNGELSARERYKEASQLLTKTSLEIYQNPNTSEKPNLRKKKKKTQEEELTDQLLINNTLALIKQLSILEKLSKSSQNKQYFQLLIQTREQLQSVHTALSECGWRHFKRNNALAKKCLTIALSLREDKSDKNLMTHLLREVHRSKVAVKNREKAERVKRSNKKINTQLTEAERLAESSQLRDAKRLLTSILKEDPEHEKAQKMLNSINIQLAGYVENLLTAGDRLYRDGEIEGAKATWRAALSLDPKDTRAREKIMRAQRVLDNLENLRRIR
jgi:tetratricopeptide (TPR) repeat protein